MQNNLTKDEINNLYQWAKEYNIKELQTKDRKKLLNIKELFISHKKRKYIKDNVFAIEDIKHIPNEIFKLTNLKKLSIDCKGLKKLPKEIGNLVNLEEFEVCVDEINFPTESCRVLKKLPDVIYNLTKLKKLVLIGNFKKISSKIKNLVNLEWLEISQIDTKDSEFNVREIVAELPNFPKLKNFFIHKKYNYRIGNEIVRDRYFLHNCKNLYIQDRDRLEEFPKNICDFSKLENLFIECYHIKEWGEEVNLLTNLKRLHIRMYGLKEPPKWIFDLITLEELTIDYPIEKLPKEIGKLINLKELNIHGSDLKKLPKEIGKLTKLKKLDISYGNYGECDKLEGVPKEICNLVNLENIQMKSEKINKKVLKGLLKAIIDNDFNNIKKIEFGKYEDTGKDIINAGYMWRGED